MLATCHLIGAQTLPSEFDILENEYSDPYTGIYATNVGILPSLLSSYTLTLLTLTLDPVPCYCPPSPLLLPSSNPITLENIEILILLTPITIPFFVDLGVRG